MTRISANSTRRERETIRSLSFLLEGEILPRLSSQDLQDLGRCDSYSREEITIEMKKVSSCSYSKRGKRCFLMKCEKKETSYRAHA